MSCGGKNKRVGWKFQVVGVDFESVGRSIKSDLRLAKTLAPTGRKHSAAGDACMLEGTGTSGMLCTKAQGQSAAWGGFLVDGECRHPSKLMSRSLKANVIPHPASLCSKVYRMGSVKWLRI
jgi:hypothetical protein